MANSLAGVAPAVVADMGFEAYKTALAPFNAFSTDFSSEVASQGSSVVTRIITGMTADTDENDYEDETGGTTTGITVTLDQYAKRTFYFTDNENDDNQTDFWEYQAQEAGYAVAKLMLTTVLAAITNANYGAAGFTGAASTFDSDDVVDVRTLCSTDGMPKNNRSMILDEDYMGALLKDAALQDASASGSTEALREGAIGRLVGFNMFESPNIPANAENLVGFACHPSALAIAVRPPNPQTGYQAAGVAWEVRTDEATGLSIGYREHYSPAKGKRYGTFEASYGFSKANALGVQRIVSA